MSRPDSEKPIQLIQSYLVTSARYNYSVLEKRIIYRILQAVQGDLIGQPIGQGITISNLLFNDHRSIVMPISMFLRDDEDKNHTRVKAALTHLSEIQITDTDDGNWQRYGIINLPKIKKGATNVEFVIAGAFYEKMMDFAKGYTQYELQIAFNFQSQYTMRFYEMISKQKRPSLTFRIETLKEEFMLENRYKDRPADFIRFVVKPAQEELQESESPYYFTFKPIKEGRAITKVQLDIHYRPQYDKQIPTQSSISWDVDPHFMRKLNERLGEVNWEPHRDILMKVQHKEQHEIDKVVRSAEKAKNPVGYIINAFKKMAAKM